MADEGRETHRHFILEGFTETETYRSRGGGGGGRQAPPRDRPTHAAALRGQLNEVRVAAERTTGDPDDPDDGLGIQVEFQSFPDIELAFESLSRENRGIELWNVRHRSGTTYATVFVPTGRLDHFEKLIEDYLSYKQDSLERPRDNRKLLDAIQAIRAASIRALWTDDDDAFPGDETEPFWCEIWLPRGRDRTATIASFRERAQNLGMQVAPGELRFPERTVLVARTALATIQRSVATLNSIAELRRAKETADFFDSLVLSEQTEWLNDLIDRTSFNGGPDAPHVCLLDTGVNRGHPLITPALATNDLHTVEPGWGTHDADGHGTEMAGLAIAGNLTDVLDNADRLEVDHRLESVKLLEHSGGNGNDFHHYGYLTAEAVSRPEVTAPARPRVFGLAVTAKDNRDRGRPTGWSATLDALAADSDDQGARPRLLVVSAGNVRDNEDWRHYPDSNDSDGIHDPAQAWNPLTVGAFTNLTRITEPDTSGYAAVAPSGALSPFSTTALNWQKHWPLKPDVVLEGGNAAIDSLSAVTVPSLRLLTTSHDLASRLFTTTNATSAATALASRMAAQVMATYPELWPETIRALIVHSADWTEAMKRAYLPPSNPSKRDYCQLVQRCGFGVPDLQRALWTVANSLTLVVQGTLQPFEKERGMRVTTRDMHLHRLPWPQDALESLADTQVEMRVTLSYFVEPNPSQRGNSRYRYQSHGLRFDVKRPTETTVAFRARVNATVERQGSSIDTVDPYWLVGTQNRHRGSLHSDIWRGTGAELASRAVIAIYPTIGWWRTRDRLGCANRSARYALVVSIRAPDTDVNLYTEVSNQVAVSIQP